MSQRASLFLFIALINFSLILMAMDFGTVVLAGGSPITPEQYGPGVYAVPALAWAGIQLTGAALGTVGAVIVAAEGRAWRLGAFACGLGNMILACLFLVFAVLSRNAPEGLLVHAMSKNPGLIISLGCAVQAWRLMIWGDEN